MAKRSVMRETNSTSAMNGISTWTKEEESAMRERVVELDLMLMDHDKIL